ncbi:pleckstrin homology domain-containing family A member 4 [Phaenicophaeus curvirostris]|uniref:pleckstrin homology domain-containing family A member 4 n=1 Tax=Phaenicophaeus curvirostris TaxID=33595 RepID=UPI0037F0B87D
MAEEHPRAGPQACRAVARVHTFGKGEQALRRDPHAPPSMKGWLHKQDSSGLRLWKRRWFVLVDLCLYYYRDSSEQRVRGGLPLPGYEIHVLPPAPRAPRFLFTAEHPGMRTYCLGAETPEELWAWVCALRRGAAPLPSSPRSLSLHVPQDPQSGGSPTSPLPAHPPCRSSLCPPGVELGAGPMPSPHRPPVPLVPPSKEAPPTPGEPRGTEAEQKPRPPGAAANQQPPPAASCAPEPDAAANQTPSAPPAPPDWLLAPGRAPPPRGGTSPPAANQASPWRRAGGRGLEREGVAGRPIRITLLQASL